MYTHFHLHLKTLAIQGTFLMPPKAELEPSGNDPNRPHASALHLHSPARRELAFGHSWSVALFPSVSIRTIEVIEVLVTS